MAGINLQGIKAISRIRMPQKTATQFFEQSPKEQSLDQPVRSELHETKGSSSIEQSVNKHLHASASILNPLSLTSSKTWLCHRDHRRHPGLLDPPRRTA